VSALDRAIRERLDAMEIKGPPDRTVRALRAVLDVHQPYQFYEDTHDCCGHCDGPEGSPEEWPCPTVRAIAAALHVEVPGGAG
jgi:hypothetical protein